MAKILYREKILLGYNPNTLLSNSSSSRRNSADVDFSDVFGGPPRCSSSTQEYYHYNNDIDSIDENDDDDDADNYGNGFGLSERPVFGYHQKRFGSDDFYDDIFGGDQFVLSSSLSSPRVVLMSPPRTSSSATAEPSSPSKFSLPGRAANTDTMTSTSMNQSLTKFFGRSLSRFNHMVQKHSTINSGDAHTSNLSSSLPSRIAVDEKRLTGDSKIKGTRDQHEPKFNMEGSKSCSKVANDTMQFHFSIYKWANTGVPSVMTSRKRSPSRPKERMTSDVNLIMEDSKRNVINVNVNVNVNEATLSSKRRMPSTAAQEREHERNNNDIAAGGGKSHVEWKLKDDKVKNNNTSSNNEVGEGHSEKDLEAKLIKQPQKIKKSNTKPLRTLFGQEKEGSKKATVEKGRKQSKVNETEQQPSLKNEVVPNHKVSRKSKVHEPSIGKTDDLRKGEVSEIAKDFVKIFNQGSSHEKSYVSIFPTKNHDEMQASYGNLGNISFESIEVVDGESFLSGEQEFNINSSGIPNSASNDGPSNDSSRASAPKTTAPYVEEDLGKVVTQDMDSPLAIESKEETQSYERKVRQWSKGKEGNIRALLSTMQNILWPNSGWKPVPLVDIIEANAVKKAYQRALLCLHPDKLQQKGAAPHHKFIAEKVFDVLQEAWDQFNSLGTL